MNKLAELNKLATLYVACRGLLRVKLATADPDPDTDSGSDTGSDAEDSGARPYTVGDAIRTVGADLGERAGVGADVGTTVGNYVSDIGSRIYGGAVNAMANSKNKWLSGIGNFLGKNHNTISNIAALGARAGANYYNQYMDQQTYDAAAKKVQDAQAAQEQAALAAQKAQPSFDANTMFPAILQGMVNTAMQQQGGYNPGYQQQGYVGYPPQGYGYQQPQLQYQPY